MSNTEVSVDISTLLRILKKYLVIIVTVTIATTFAAYIMSEFMIEKRYAASAKFYIENRQAQGEAVNIGDINASRSMVNTCAELFSTRDIVVELKNVIDVPYTVEQIRDMITMGTSNNTEYLTITITADDAKTTVYMLEHFVTICENKFNAIIESGKITIADSPYSSGKPVFPSIRLFLAGGFLLGFALTYLVVFIKEILDVKVKTEDDLFRIYEIPVFAEVMSFTAKIKGEYGYE